MVFLDIKMPQGSGFDLLSQLEKVDFEVIFVTAYDNFAIEAFKFSAFGYLMKPLKENELSRLITKISDYKLLQSKKADAHKRVKVLIDNYGDDIRVFKLVLSNVEGFKVVDIKDIIRIEGDGNYTRFIIDKAKPVISTKNLGEYEELLNDHGFFRIHQSTVVNLRHVIGFQKSEGGYVEMSNGELGKLSRHRKADFMERFF